MCLVYPGFVIHRIRSDWGWEGVQFFEKLDCAVHCFRCGAVAFLATLFDALVFISVVFEIMIVEFYMEGNRLSVWIRIIQYTLALKMSLPIHSSHFILLNPMVTKYFLHMRVSRLPD